MRQLTRLAAAVIAGAGFLATTSHAVPPETIIDTRAAGDFDVNADVTIPGIGTVKIALDSADGNTFPDVVAVQSRTPGQNFPPIRIPFVVMAGDQMDRSIKLGKSELVDAKGDLLAAFILAQLTDTRAAVKDEILFLQALPVLNERTSLAEALVNTLLFGGANGGRPPDPSGLAPDDPLRTVFEGTVRVTKGKANGVLRGSRGNSRYRGRWSVRWEGFIEGGSLDGTPVRGRVTIRFTSTGEPADRPPDPLPQPARDALPAGARGE